MYLDNLSTHVHGNYVVYEQGSMNKCNSSELVLCTHHEAHEHEVEEL